MFKFSTAVGGHHTRCHTTHDGRATRSAAIFVRSRHGQPTVYLRAPRGGGPGQRCATWPLHDDRCRCSINSSVPRRLPSDMSTTSHSRGVGSRRRQAIRAGWGRWETAGGCCGEPVCSASQLVHAAACYEAHDREGVANEQEGVAEARRTTFSERCICRAPRCCSPWSTRGRPRAA